MSQVPAQTPVRTTRAMARVTGEIPHKPQWALRRSPTKPSTALRGAYGRSVTPSGRSDSPEDLCTNPMARLLERARRRSSLEASDGLGTSEQADSRVEDPRKQALRNSISRDSPPPRDETFDMGRGETMDIVDPSRRAHRGPLTKTPEARHLRGSNNKISAVDRVTDDIDQLSISPRKAPSSTARRLRDTHLDSQPGKSKADLLPPAARVPASRNPRTQDITPVRAPSPVKRSALRPTILSTKPKAFTLTPHQRSRSEAQPVSAESAGDVPAASRSRGRKPLYAEQGAQPLVKGEESDDELNIITKPSKSSRGASGRQVERTSSPSARPILPRQQSEPDSPHDRRPVLPRSSSSPRLSAHDSREGSLQARRYNLAKSHGRITDNNDSPPPSVSSSSPLTSPSEARKRAVGGRLQDGSVSRVTLTKHENEECGSEPPKRSPERTLARLQQLAPVRCDARGPTADAPSQASISTWRDPSIVSISSSPSQRANRASSVDVRTPTRASESPSALAVLEASLERLAAAKRRTTARPHSELFTPSKREMPETSAPSTLESSSPLSSLRPTLGDATSPLQNRGLSSIDVASGLVKPARRMPAATKEREAISQHVAEARHVRRRPSDPVRAAQAYFERALREERETAGAGGEEDEAASAPSEEGLLARKREAKQHRRKSAYTYVPAKRDSVEDAESVGHSAFCADIDAPGEASTPTSPIKRFTPVTPKTARDAARLASARFLRGLHVVVDVRDQDGDDASGSWIEMLRGAGAKVTSRVPSMSSRSPSHIVYKSGRPATLHYFRACDDPKPLLVGVNWVLKCLQEARRVDEEPYLVEIGKEAVFRKRRISMAPRAAPGALLDDQSSRETSPEEVAALKDRRLALAHAPAVPSPLGAMAWRPDASTDGSEMAF
ncbi:MICROCEPHALIN [Ceraceosorus bombacis]|uniref:MICROCEPHALIN n=1 Tax=Ceraceosorus bombacis TaxID=401625 RepID=A0A0P1BEI9_9BASI|nr:MICROCEPHALIN [Ceraceosorus bombacis]